MAPKRDPVLADASHDAIGFVHSRLLVRLSQAGAPLSPETEALLDELVIRSHEAGAQAGRRVRRRRGGLAN